MIWEPYIPYPNHENLGVIASVYLNEGKTMIKRSYQINGITSSGKPAEKSLEYIENKWLAETEHLLRFENKPWVPELIDINYNERYIIQKYYGPDLLIQGYDDIPDIEDQVIEIYEYFKEIDVYKLNGSLSNMTKKDGKVIMFDFKYMKKRRADLTPSAIREIDLWLSKISPTIAARLKELL